MKKLLLSVLLFYLICNVGYAENLNTRFSVSEATKYKIKNSEDCNAYILTDNITGIKYLVLDNTHYCGNAGLGDIAITPLIKPAIYVHKK